MMPTQLNDSPAGQVLTVLQRRGKATVKDLEEALGVTATAVRQQTTNLVAEGYVQQESERSGRGRPRHIYSLTAMGRTLFPHHYDEFTNGLLREILISEGPQKFRDLLGRMGRRLAAQYEGELAGLATVERTARLTELLNAKGILAEMRLQPDGIVFHEYTCPYYELARENRAICDMEEGMIAQAIRQPVELVACTLDGSHGCQFRIQPETDEIVLEELCP
jgi:DeoR family transcriptional regulator, suf operon transcriptional repressor